MIRKAAFFALFLCLFAGFPHAQDRQTYPRGAIFDEAAYNKLPRKMPLGGRAYEGLPKAYSLKEYAPLPGDQNDYGTCVAWASAYAARTISESVAMSRKNPADTTANAFSPVYIYRNIRPDDPECREGAAISRALELMKESGAVKMIHVERTMKFPKVDLSRYETGKKYPIAGYVTLFSREERSKPGLVTRMVKMSLAEGKPVIIGMNTPDSFLRANAVWRPEESPHYFYGGHAMCVVGYDDEKDGGAFEVINSWGGKWGNHGFMWIPYDVFVDFVIEGYEMIENLAVYSDTVKFAGSTRIEILEGSGVKTAPLVSLSGGVYKTAEALGEGTRFRFVTGSGESAYVYVFAATQAAGGGEFFSPALLFPRAGVSPLLNYTGGAALPGGGKGLVVDAAPGMEYLFVLYAKQALDIRAIMRRFKWAAGTPAERLAAAVGSHLLPATAVKYDNHTAAFTAETENPRAVAALVVAIDHR
jgi:C1A family cysteine protease